MKRRACPSTARPQGRAKPNGSAAIRLHTALRAASVEPSAPLLRALAWVLCSAHLLSSGLAQAVEPDANAAPESWAVHGEATNVTQHHPTFNSPYSGPISLQAGHQTAETTDLALYLGARLWRHAQFWVNSEIDQGFGLSATQGIAGYPNGEAYKAGADRPYLRLSRAFLRINEPLGGDLLPLEASQSQLRGESSQNNLITTIGKFSVVDVFDVNTYAHDARRDFLNWAVIDSGAFDYAADPWGFTYGIASELTVGRWTARGGVFQLSREPNALVHGLSFGDYMMVAELEERHDWLGAAGKVKLLWFSNHAPMARYRDAVSLAGTTGGSPDVSRVRRRSTRDGVALNVEQEITPDAGAFLRLSVTDGSKEAYEFTEINRSLSTGLSVGGRAWGRAADRIGLAVAVNAISSDARQYFGSGGQGILIGDGKLRYGAEKIVEASYVLSLFASATFSLDYQFIKNPAYNRDRGPVPVYGLRIHGEF